MKRTSRILAAVAFSLFLTGVSHCDASQENLIRNADCSDFTPAGLPRHWEFRTEQPDALSVEDGVVTIQGAGGENQFLIYRNTGMESGKQYVATVEVRVAQGERFRFYYEQVYDSRRKSVNSHWLVGTGDWQKVQFTFTPEGEATYDHMVINVEGAVDLSFRDLQVTVQPEGSAAVGSEAAPSGQPAPKAPEVEGVTKAEWKVNGNATFVEIPNEGKGVRVPFVSNYVAGAEILKVPVKPGKTYEFQYRVKGEDPEGAKGQSFFHGFGVLVDLHKGNQQDMLKSPWDDVWAASFQNKNFVFTIPEDYAHADADIRLIADDKSQVIFTGFKLVEKETLPKDFVRVLITSPAYRKSIYSSKPVDEIAATVVADKHAAALEATLNHNGKTLATQKATFSDLKAAIRFPAAALEVGDYEVVFKVRAADGALIKESTETIRKLPPGKVEVVADQRKQFWINGKPFYPIAIWRFNKDHHERESYWQYLASKGANLFLETSASGDVRDTLKLLDLAEKCGVKLVIRVPQVQEVKPNVVRLWLHRLHGYLTPELLAHPALFGYFLVDEPAWVGVPYQKLQVSYDELKKVDPYRPIWINEAPRGSVDLYRMYSWASDIFGIDIYPVPAGSHSALEDKTLTSVGKYSLRVDEALDGLKPNWTVLQGFAWGNLSKGRPVLYPTVAESRFMAFDALLNKTDSISYYGLSHIDNAQFPEDLGKVINEVQRMSALWMFAEVEKDVMQGPIRTRVLAYKGKRWMIALNTLDQPYQATLQTGFTTAKALVMEEGREVAVSNGVIREEFPGFGTRIYGEAPLPPPVEPIPSFDGPNPFLTTGDENFSAYQGNAKWIWDGSKLAEMHSEIWAALPIHAAQGAEKAQLRISADDFAQVWLNGKQIGKADGWKAMTVIDLKPHLKPGDNLLLIKAWDGFNLPAGLLAELHLTDAAGKEQIIVTDENWKIAANEPDPQTFTGNLSRWAAAKVIASYGEGKWRDRVMVPNL